MAAAADAAQLSFYLKWLNNEILHSDYAGKVPKVEALEELRDGIVLLHLVASVTNNPVPKYKKMDQAKLRTEVNMEDNLSQVFSMIKGSKINLQFVSGTDIVQAKPQPIMAFIWAIIYAQQIGNIQTDDGKRSGKAGLLMWVQLAVGSHGVEVSNFQSSWSSGLALAALIHNFRPDVVDLDKAREMSAADRLAHCMERAEEVLAIPQLITPEIMQAGVHEKPVLGYVSCFFKCFSSLQATEQAKKRLVHFGETQKRIDQLLWEYHTRSQVLQDFVKEHLPRLRGLPSVEEKLIVARKRLDAANEFRKTDLVDHRQLTSTLESTLSNLQTALSCCSRPAYEPDVPLAKVLEQWQELEEAAERETSSARSAYRAGREATTAKYIAVSNRLFDELGGIQRELGSLTGDDPAELLAAVEPLQKQHAALQEAVDEARALASELAEAHVNTDDVSGLKHGIEDITFQYKTLRGSLDRRRNFFQLQLDQKKGSGVSAEKMEEIRQTFNHFDKNESGTLSCDEFFSALRAVGQDFTQEEARAKFKQHAKKDAMTYDGFVGVMKSLEAQGSVGPDDVLQALKAIADGKPITAEVLKEAMCPEVAAHLLQQVPKNADGTLDFQKYCKDIYSSTTVPSEPPTGLSPPTRPRGVSMRGRAVESSFLAVDPPSDEEES